jgi:3-isopropylmalate/(R)-2-methylmalate dehydratase small subunit
LGKIAFIEYRPEFSKEVKSGDIIVAGKNFGCGSSREHAPVAIKAAGVSAVLAKSFARIFFRNAINIGLPLFVCEEIDRIDDGDLIEINFETGRIYDKTKDLILRAKPLPKFIQKIVEKGGLVNFLRSESYV